LKNNLLIQQNIIWFLLMETILKEEFLAYRCVKKAENWGKIGMDSDLQYLVIIKLL